MSPQVEAPAKGVRFALQAFGCTPRLALIREARVKYRLRAEIDDDAVAKRRVDLASRIILRIILRIEAGR